MKGSFSKLNTFSDGLRVLKTIFDIFKDYRPLLFFLILSVLFFINNVLPCIDPEMEFVEYYYLYIMTAELPATGMIIFSLLFFCYQIRPGYNIKIFNIQF